MQKTVAIDGPVAAGKTVVGREVARQLGCRFLDTGTMYRAVTLAALQRDVNLEDERALEELAHSLDIELVGAEDGDRLMVDGQDITQSLRTSEVERGVSLVARVRGVRSAMVRIQREMAGRGQIVMVGRDIGTVVLPDAPVKVFLNASVEVRARRRYNEMAQAGTEVEYEQVLADLQRRDRIDSERTDSPLRPADDAVQLFTDDMEIGEVSQRILSLVRCD
ncbi:MAG: (d)CMP kinase [Ardenticatenaceae bacterium]